jgi:hypothetical protein
MASKKGKTVDPAKIVDANVWVQYFKAKYINLMLRKSDGAYLVFDPTKYLENPEKTKSEEPAKVIQVKRGYDAIVIANFSKSKELRDKAGEKLHSLQTSSAGKFEELSKDYKSLETQLFEKIEEAKISEDLVARVKLIKEIGLLQKQLADKDVERYNVKYPLRENNDLYDKIVPYKYIEYESFSDKDVALSVFNTFQTKIADRVVEKTM